MVRQTVWGEIEAGGYYGPLQCEPSENHTSVTLAAERWFCDSFTHFFFSKSYCDVQTRLDSSGFVWIQLGCFGFSSIISDFQLFLFISILRDSWGFFGILGESYYDVQSRWDSSGFIPVVSDSLQLFRISNYSYLFRFLGILGDSWRFLETVPVRFARCCIYRWWPSRARGWNVPSRGVPGAVRSEATANPYRTYNRNNSSNNNNNNH